jgi:hypothetical protein
MIKRTILFALVTLMFTAQTVFTVSYGFEVSGSKRVPTYVPRDQNLRDPQPVRARIINIERADECESISQAAPPKCYYEREAINPIDNRNFIEKILNPRGPVHYETHRNCYSQREQVKQCIFTGYIVTHESGGKIGQTFTPNRPRGRYFTIMSK